MRLIQASGHKNLLKITRLLDKKKQSDDNLCPEAIEGATLPFQGVDYIERSDGFSLGMFGICNRIPDDIFQEDLEHPTSFFVNQT